jgi:hypothetical protein
MLSVLMLNVTYKPLMPSVIMLNANYKPLMLSVIMLNVTNKPSMLNAIMLLLSVVTPFFKIYFCRLSTSYSAALILYDAYPWAHISQNIFIAIVS